MCADSTPTTPFRHEALMYAGEDEFLAGTLPFVRAGVAAGEPVLVVVDAAKARLLRAELNGGGALVQFADMAAVGANPARIIPAWHDFVTTHAAPGRGLRGIGEPIWPGRSAAELAECHRHEALLNLAFADADGFTLLCPYDTSALDPAVIEEAEHTHPVLREGDVERPSVAYPGLEGVAAPYGAPLPEPAAAPAELPFDGAALPELRTFISACAAAAGLAADRARDLMLSVSEVAANSVRHGGGEGLLRVWVDRGAVVCEVRDGGRIDRPLAGRRRPVAGQVGGYGLWLANQLCDLVQLRTFATGSVVRVHMRLG